MSDRELKILMIDDDEQILFALRAVFRFQGWESVSAKAVLTGLELFLTADPATLGGAHLGSFLK